MLKMEECYLKLTSTLTIKETYTNAIKAFEVEPYSVKKASRTVQETYGLRDNAVIVALNFRIKNQY